jgi:general secretion pathway protein M
VTLRERLDRLEERERRLLGLLVLVLCVLAIFLLPLGVTALLHGDRTENAALRDTIAQIESSRAAVEKNRAVRKAVEDRYSRPAPQLTSFLATVAKEVELEIPESQDRQPVPHGKRYEEKATRISLRKVGMLKLAKFMERIEQSGHPVSISQLTIRKRGEAPDAYDADMTVSAFERKPDKVAAKSTKPAASGEGEGAAP